MFLPAPVHVMHIDISRQLARHIMPWPVRTLLVLHRDLASQVPNVVVVAVAQLLERVPGLSGSHAYVQHKINPRHIVEFGFPETRHQCVSGGVRDADWLGVDDDADGGQGHGGLADGGRGLGVQDGQIVRQGAGDVPAGVAREVILKGLRRMSAQGIVQSGAGGHVAYTEAGDQDDELILGLVRGAHEQS